MKAPKQFFCNYQLLYWNYDNISLIMNLNDHVYASQRKASDSAANFSALSNPADAQNVSCLGLCDRDICPKSYASYGIFNP